MAGGEYRPSAPIGLSDEYFGVALRQPEVGAAGYRAEAHARLSAGPATPTRESSLVPRASASACTGPLSAVDTAVARHPPPAVFPPTIPSGLSNLEPVNPEWSASGPPVSDCPDTPAPCVPSIRWALARRGCRWLGV
ncbi:hypothetical protein Airi01_096630 [Actinoallomurus iriomotensis]|uniref:Uncharacterized protein n=1 Tax=Actinoallomurus iriomotensis TaxID=478107 RepID=A0A9W6VX34_9ACTN|nr:hypothetical protein Airi01_096630 [Actinoallomurus iriomotensis]